MNCRLCEILSEPPGLRQPHDTLLRESTAFEWVPGLGALVEGYSLIVSKKHVFNTAALPRPTILELEAFLSDVVHHLTTIYGTGVVVFEHGSMGPRDCAGGCIVHQHLHLLPTDLPDLPPILETSFQTIHGLTRLTDLRPLHTSQTPYIYYRTSRGLASVYEAPILPRQYLRQVLAALLHEPATWDWHTNPRTDRIDAFLKRLSLHH